MNDATHHFHETDKAQCLDCGRHCGRWCDTLIKCPFCGSTLERVASYEAGQAAFVEYQRTQLARELRVHRNQIREVA